MSSELDAELAPWRSLIPLARAIDLSHVGAYRGFREVIDALLALRGARVSIAGHAHEGAPIMVPLTQAAFRKSRCFGKRLVKA